MIMNKYQYKKILIATTLILGSLNLFSQNDSIKIEGIVVKSLQSEPVKGAVISSSYAEKRVETDENGKFSITVKSHSAGTISAWLPGFYTNEEPINGRNFIKIMLINEGKVGYSPSMNLPFWGTTAIENKQTNLFTIQKNDIRGAETEATKTFKNIPGLQLIGKSGMPGEGQYFSIRDVSSITGNSNPLIVINGVPYMPDMNPSGIIGGFSKDILAALAAQDIHSVTVLKGSDATLYGTLGSNGVILIETDKATDLKTRVQLISQFGFDFNQSTYPVLGSKDYKGLMSNIALSKYPDMADVLTKFPYLVDDPNYYYKYLYNNNTNWQDQIYRTGVTTDHVLKIKGGDAIAKYDVSIGYQNNQGQVKGTDSEKFFARLNSDVNLSRNLSFTSDLSMSSVEYNVQEQGMLSATNPLLAALKKGPIFSPYQKDAENNRLPDLAIIRDAEGNLIENNMVSNPLAIVKSLEANSHGYDVLINLGLNYKLNSKVNLKAIGGLLYNYTHEKIFIPGKSKLSFMPLLDGVAENTVRAATGEVINFYYGANGSYSNTFGYVHNLKAIVGMQSVINSTEYDAGTGYNTANDFYHTLNNVTSSSRRYFGYINKWNWMNAYANAKYTYNHELALGATITADAASSTGDDANRVHYYPAINLAWYANNSVLQNVDFINTLTLRAEFASTGNSRFASSLSKYYYVNKVFRELSGTVRAGIPNTEIIPERNNTFNVGLDAWLLNNRIGLTVDVYNTKSTNMVMPVSISSAFGTNYLYDNAASAQNRGVELSLNILAVDTKDFKWYVNGTLSWTKNKVTSLGKENRLVMTMDDGSALITEVGKPVYSFYGYQTAGVFSTSQEASTAHNGSEPLKMVNGQAFQAGDIHFVDQNGDGVIDENDRVNLGSAAPKYFGSFGTTLQYKSFELNAYFAYSVGNKMYNAVRREMESMKDFSNQLSSVNNRWVSEGQITSMPRAIYGDPMDNARFSDRWIEKASYLKLKDITLSYKFNFMSGTKVFVSAENLFTITDYLGLDPETMYSYDASMRGFDYGKIGLPRSIKLGFNLQF